MPQAEISTIAGIAILLAAVAGLVLGKIDVATFGILAAAAAPLIGIRQTPTAVKGAQETAPEAPPVETKPVA